MSFEKNIKNCRKHHQAAGFQKAKNLHNEQGDILYKATTPTLLSCIFVIHTYIPFKILL